MNTIERRRFARNWPYLLLFLALILATCAMDKPEQRSFGPLSYEQKRDIMQRQHVPHSLEMAAMVKNQARRW